MARLNIKQTRSTSGRFYLTVVLLSLIAAYALVVKGQQQPPSTSTSQNRLAARAAEPVCNDVHLAGDQCAFVRQYCVDDEPGLVSYLGFYYCGLPNVKPIAFALLAFWLGLLFSTIGIAASDFFSVNLSTIASVLRMPESLAGVTFLALGNGSPDVFSTFAAMGSNSGSMAVGELIGAAGFITAVVAGSMALVREFKVSKKTFVRDIVFFILAVTFTMLFLLDGKIRLWECSLMIGFYVFYVSFVVAWHWYASRRKRRRSKQAASRSHFSVVSSPTHDDIEPYQDAQDENAEDNGTVGQRRRLDSLADFDALESGLLIHVEDASREEEDDEEDEDNKRIVASEMASSMRVNRPRWRRAHSTVAPIRPSLIGALEFRSVLASLAKSRNMRLAPLQRGYSDHNSAGLLSGTSSEQDPEEPYIDDPDFAVLAASHSASRNRALSSGDAPRHLSQGNVPDPALLLQPSKAITNQESDSATAHMQDNDRSAARQAVGQRSKAPGLSTASTVGGHLAPPPDLLRLGLSPDSVAEPTQRALPALSLNIPNANLHPSQNSSPSLSPFPSYESPVSPGYALSRQPYLQLPSPAVQEYDHIPGLDPPDAPKPIKWWPYNILPPPHILWRTLVPTLQSWREKNIWDKIFSILSVPSVFLLVITLPVVETEPLEGEEDEDGQNQPAHLGASGLEIPGTAIASESQAALIPETEWQEYRRRSNSFRSRSSSASRPRLSALNTPAEAVNSERFPFPEQNSPNPGLNPGPYAEQPLSIATAASEPSTEQEASSWKRWLVAVQIFTGPLFTVFIVWSKYMDQPTSVLVKMILWSLAGSLVLLALLLVATSPETKPEYHFLFCFFGFVISVAWISTIAEEVVGVLKAVGVILGMSEAILGLTVFAVGNSVGDLVADITVARLGFPVMALSACFGGPMLNILLGIGLGGTYMTIKSANDKHSAHPDVPLHYRSYHLDLPGTLFISAMTVLVTLLMLLILVPSNDWMMTRKIGLTLIALWAVGTIANVVVEVTGVWEAVQ